MTGQTDVVGISLLHVRKNLLHFLHRDLVILIVIRGTKGAGVFGGHTVFAGLDRFSEARTGTAVICADDPANVAIDDTVDNHLVCANAHQCLGRRPPFFFLL